MKKNILIYLLIVCASLMLTTVCYADSAEVLPKGVTRIDVDAEFYFTIKQRYDSDGNSVPLAEIFNLPIGFLLGDPNIPGSTDVKFEVEHQEVEVLLSHGMTDKFSIGINIPYYWTKNKVKAKVVDNPVITIDDLQGLLKLYGYEPLEDWSNDSIGDIEAGGRYQYLKNENWRLAFTGAVRFPTGDGENIDNLTSFAHGDDAYAILLHSNNDYTGFKNIILNATLRYEMVFSHTETYRVPAPGEFLTGNKETVDIDPGDVLEIEVQGKYQFDNGLGFSLAYEYGRKFEDSFSGDSGNSYKVLEENSDAKSHIYRVNVSYSTINKYVAKEFPVPLNVSIGYRNRFAGENTLNSKYVVLWGTVYF